MKTFLSLIPLLFLLSCKPDKTDHNRKAFSDSIRSESLKYTILNDLGYIPQKTTIWTPTANQLDTMTSLLRGEINSKSDKIGHLQSDSLLNYYQQYVCYVKGGDSIVFINAFCRVGETMESNDDGQLKLYRFDWQHEFLQVDDGGSCYWQAIINYSKKMIQSFTFNGKA